MLGDGGCEEDDISQIYEAGIQFQVGQYYAHHSLKSGRIIFKHKRHHFKLIQLISCYKRSLFSRQPATPMDYWSVTTTLFFSMTRVCSSINPRFCHALEYGVNGEGYGPRYQFYVGKARTAFAFVFVTCFGKAARVLINQPNSWFLSLTVNS